MLMFAFEVAQRYDDNHMDGWDGGWMWLWGSLMMLVFAAILAGAVWFAVRAAHPRGDRRARDILDERYARGEVSTEEYRERLQHLS